MEKQEGLIRQLAASQKKVNEYLKKVRYYEERIEQFRQQAEVERERKARGKPARVVNLEDD